MGLVAAVFVGSVVPVLPTGVVVSSMVVVVSPLAAALVVLIAAVAAFAGDLLTLALVRLGGRPVRRWLDRNVDPARMERYRRRLARNGTTLLVTSRLIPGGRIPVIVAVGVSGYDWRRYATGGALAALVWAVVYAAVGLLAGQVTDEAWLEVLLAVLAAALVAGGPALTRTLRAHLGTRPGRTSHAHPGGRAALSRHGRPRGVESRPEDGLRDDTRDDTDRRSRRDACIEGSRHL